MESIIALKLFTYISVAIRKFIVKVHLANSDHKKGNPKVAFSIYLPAKWLI